MDKLADYYARRAPEYERFYDKPERQADLSLLRERVARLFAGRRVLEIACGTGYWTAVMAPEAREVMALDVNEEVLALAREKPLPAGKVEFKLADAFALPDLGRRHDGLFAGFWWSHVPRADIPRGTRRAGRAAAPGAPPPRARCWRFSTDATSRDRAPRSPAATPRATATSRAGSTTAASTRC
jgi:ubiquinone/menaquinone biosynthesis C-methylase UbiE